MDEMKVGHHAGMTLLTAISPAGHHPGISFVKVALQVSSAKEKVPLLQGWVNMQE